MCGICVNMALRRQVKNVVKNFTDIEVKVREATSNDPWGPSSSLTSEIADATYNVQAFTEIMTLLWKRINDHGKNWRHVYKSLVVLDYIVKTGSDRVARQCRENIFAIKTLKDFQFIDKDGKDQGINVREKSKQLVALLKDDDRLKSERQRALKAKERFSQSEGGIGNTSFPKNRKFQGTMKYTETGGSVDDSNIPSRTWKEPERSEDSRSTDGRIDSDIEKVRPSNEAEEEMQLQIALAMSREEAEKDERTTEGDRQRLNMAVNESQQQAVTSTLLNLTDPSPVLPTNTNAFDPWEQGAPQVTSQQPTTNLPHSQPLADPWGSTAQPKMNGIGMNVQPSSMNQPLSDPWGSPATVSKPADPWGSPEPAAQLDPWAMPAQAEPIAIQDPFAPQNPSLSMPYNMGIANLTSQPSTNLFMEQPSVTSAKPDSIQKISIHIEWCAPC